MITRESKSRARTTCNATAERRTLKMETGRDCVGEKLAPFNPSGDEVIRVAIEMLQVYQPAPQAAKRSCCSSSKL